MMDGDGDGDDGLLKLTMAMGMMDGDDGRCESEDALMQSK